MNLDPCLERAFYYAQIWFWFCILCDAVLLKVVWKLRWREVLRELSGPSPSRLPHYWKEVSVVVILGGAGVVFFYFKGQCA